MNKTLEHEALRLTQECLTHYWELDIQFMLNHCDENVSWIGAEQKEFIRGYENVKKNFDDLLLYLRSCYMLNQEFYVAQNSGKTCTVIGRYIVTTDSSNDYFLQAQQCCTFIWELKPEGLKIVHMHVSNPMGELKIAEGERFVNSLGYMANKYIERKIKDEMPNHQIIVNYYDGSSHFLRTSEILYVTASRNDLFITTINGEIQAKMSISDFMQQTDNEFLKVHRSYAVNLNYISRFERYVLTMKNDDTIPIPVKKYNSIREELLKVHGINID